MKNSTLRNTFYLAVFSLISAFYYFLQWSPSPPILGGDHAAYLLMADYLSPFGTLDPQVIESALTYIYVPPLYPLILGWLGVSHEQVLLAHVITVTFLLVSLVLSYLWIQAETQDRSQAFWFTLIFSLMPAVHL